MSFDFLVVGAGLSGAVMARQLTDAGKKCLVIDKSWHIAGSCYDEPADEYYVCKSSGHIFHTNSKTLWDYVNHFGEWQQYHHKVMSRVDGKVFSFPINLMTLHQLWGVTTPDEARQALLERRVEVPDKHANMEAWCLATLGQELYETFIKGYTQKQWKRSPAELPASIVRRLPVRLTYDDGYFESAYQAMPTNGYTKFISNLLDGINVQLHVDYLAFKEKLDGLADHIIYTGPIDAFYNYCYGRLDYRMCDFAWSVHKGDFQGAATVNYPEVTVPHTRIVEFSHFYKAHPSDSIVMTETPSDEGEPLYPVRDEKNTLMYNQYAAIPNDRTTFVGRLAKFVYYDMAPCIAQALGAAEDLL